MRRKFASSQLEIKSNTPESKGSGVLLFCVRLIASSLGTEPDPCRSDADAVRSLHPLTRDYVATGSTHDPAPSPVESLPCSTRLHRNSSPPRKSFARPR